VNRVKGRFFLDYGALIALGILIVVNAIWQPDVFLRPENVRNLLSQNAGTGILAVGMTLVMVGGGIDLSVGSLMAFVAALGVSAMNKVAGTGEVGVPALLVATLVTIGAGSLLGYINGTIVTLGRVAPFIATLVGLVGFRSLALAMADGGEIRANMGIFEKLGNGGIPFTGGPTPMVLPWPVISFVLIAVGAHVLLEKTRFGRHLIAVGANERAAHYSAINVDRVKRAVYALMGGFAGVAALGLAARMNSVSSAQLGLYTELDAIAAAVIGGTSMSGGRGRIWATVVGVLILGIITNMLVASGISAYWQGFVKGVIILLAVLIQRGKSER
jgi:ribose transport system permease protein